MNDTANPKLVKIRKLLASAESEALLGHAEAADGFRDKAMALMIAHGISEVMVDAARHRDDKPIQVAIETPKPYSLDKQQLLASVADGFNVRCIRVRGTTTSFLVGFVEDIERVEMLYTSLLIQAFGEMSKIKSEDAIYTWRWLTPGEKRSQRAAYNRSWLAGYSSTVGRRLREAKARAAEQYEAETGTSTALVLVDRKDRVALAYQQAFPNSRTGTSRRLSGGGYGAGRQAGERADLGNKRLGETRSALNS